MSGLLTIVGIIGCGTIFSQSYLTEAYLAFDGRFDEWEFVHFNEEGENTSYGRLSLKWPLQGNWNEWRYELNEFNGEIRRKWPGLNDQWELRGYDDLITFSPKWRNDLNEWTIRYNNTVMTLRTKSRDNPTFWRCDMEGGYFEIFTERINDPSIWIIEDYLPEHVDIEAKIVLTFIALYHSFPK